MLAIETGASAIQHRQYGTVRRTRRHPAADQAIPAQGCLQPVILEVLINKVARRQGRDAEELEHVLLAESPGG